MVGSNKKKRKGSTPPTRDTVVKRGRTDPMSTPDPRTQAPRAQSFVSSDHNHSLTAGAHINLPTNGDWVFRIKVISSNTAPDEELFREAVQGLVEICFPQGVLEEMGVGVVKQHMLEKRAPVESITRMTETYGMEMVHCITHMLGKYLDTPAKVKSAVKTVIAASTNLHMDVEDDELNDILTILSRDDSRSGTAVPNELTDTVENGHVSTNIKKRRKGKAQDQTDRHDVGRRLDEMVVDVEESTSRTEAGQQTSDREDLATKKKIHASWRWAIDPECVSAEALIEAFQRPADLFAFHALPIVRGILGTDAKRKDLRHKMQEMLEEMPANEYEKWIESFQKLHDGDEVMLVRIPPELVGAGRTAATPAPIDSRRYVGNATRAGCTEGSVRRRPAHADDLALHLSPIKSEGNTTRVIQEDDEERRAEKRDNEVATATTAFRQLSTEGSDCTKVHDVQNSQTGLLSKSTPIVDLLWGSASFNGSARPTVVRHIMQNIDQRIIKPSIGVRESDGVTTVFVMKQTFKNQLLGGLPNAIRGKTRDFLEKKLVGCVLANLTSFTELLAEPFIFTNLVPSSTCVFNALFDSLRPLAPKDTDTAKGNLIAIRSELYDALDNRGIDTKSIISASSTNRNTLNAQIGTILTRSDSDVVKRREIERILRPIALKHRDKFQDLKTSLLVRAWERETGQKW